MRACPDCNQIVQEDDVFCDNCGYDLITGGNVVQPAAQPPPQAAYRAAGALDNAGPGICSACGYSNTPGEMFCDQCGMQLSQPTASSVPPQQPIGGAAPGMGGAGTCSACGYQNLPGEAFCANCGVQLAPVASIPPPPPVYVPPLPQPGPPAYQPQPGGVVAGTCGDCGYTNSGGDIYCQNCGASLGHSPPLQPYTPVQPAAPVVGGGQAPGVFTNSRLVVSVSGAVLNIAPGSSEATIGRADTDSGWMPDIDLNAHGGAAGGVSRQHARLIALSGQVVIEDLNSTNFTLVNKQRVQPGQRLPVKNGDEIRLGRVALIYQG